jgi:hypothetical protein
LERLNELMTILPIIERELRLRARRQTTYWVRVAVGSFGALLCVMHLTFGGRAVGAASVGQDTFLGLVTAAFLLCCGAFVLTADSISTERREGTLGLLFLTRVRGNDVLLGKLGAAGVTGLGAVIVMLPVLMIPVLSGGVTAGEAFRKGLVLLNALFVGLVVGLFVSAEGEGRFGVFRRAFFVVLCLLIVPTPFWLFRSEMHPWSQLAAGFSPLTSLLASGDTEYGGAPMHYWQALIQLHLLGWALLWWTNVVLRRNLREPVSIAQVARAKGVRQQAKPATPPWTEPLTKYSDPIAWLLRRQRGLALAVWAGVALGVSNWLLLPFVARFLSGGFALQAVFWPTALVLRTAEACLFVWVSSRFFVEARRTGEMELLATTPYGATGLVSAQCELLKRLFRWPILVLVLPVLFQGCTVLILQRSAIPDSWQLHYAICPALAGVNTWLNVVALCWVGMWFGLRARSQPAAIIWTVGLIGLVPHLLSWSASILAAIVARFMSNVWPTSYFLSSSVTGLVTLAYLLWLIHRTRKLMSGDLRVAELQPLALAKSLGDVWREIARTVGRARHWTPS